MNESSQAGSAGRAESWETYWQGTAEAGAWGRGGASHPAVLAFWDQFFADARERLERPRVLDLAAGNGAVVERALAAFGPQGARLHCVDLSDAAVENIRARFPGVTALAADAASVPLDDGGFDIVTSQFGIEYADPAAFDEAARLLAPGGRLALLLWSAGFETFFFVAATMSFLARLTRRQWVAVSGAALFRMFVATVQLEAAQVWEAIPLSPAASAVSAAVASLLFARYGLPAAMLFSAGLGLHLFLPPAA